MKLIFIRHGDPDYVHDSLTPRGRAEAAALHNRLAGWRGFEAAVSPLGRAQETARRALAGSGVTPETLPWLEEFRGRLPNSRICWDLLPAAYDADPLLRDPVRWPEAALYQNTNVAAVHAETKAGLYALLARYGYRPRGSVFAAAPDARRDAVAVLFCHMAVSMECLAILLNQASPVVWHQWFLPPASITVLGAEEREPGLVQWRMQAAGDVRHLWQAGLEPSPSGSFAPLFLG